MYGIHKRLWHSYFELVYLVTALVPSDTACLANSPGRRRRTAVWISREVMVDLKLASALQKQQYQPLVVMRQLASLRCDPLEQVVDERVHDGHCLGRDPSVRVNLLQHLNATKCKQDPAGKEVHTTL